MSDIVENGIVEITDDNFASIISQPGACLVDFWAAWCQPCVRLVPVLAQAAKELQGKVAFYKIDTERYQAVAMKYEIAAIPTLLLFKDGELVARRTGGDLTKNSLINFINSNLE